ncbi:hypothetical protein D9M68_522700 [compost metagenome]
MKKSVIAWLSGVLVAYVPMAGAASAATVTNKDSETAVLVVVEGESRMEVAIAAGATEMICPSGCFVTAPSGDRIGLQGDENVEIVNGNVVVK